MTVGADAYRNAVRKFASGVTVVTVASANQLHGMTASSFASVSLDPPRILVCLDKTSRTLSLLSEVERFGVSVLARDQEEIARAFAASGDKPFDSLDHRAGETGVPLLGGAIAWMECSTFKVIDGGDHVIILGDVEACGAQDGKPLVYFDRSYRSITED